ncbi:MAG: methyltransferase type 11 [Gammaproteobacteria bacterium]|nr:methyltransferase type 11 [Gammaproteobacteria bacterium]MDE0413853.1 methyltransferase type 11 [Gammaproteobacteria bacterium]MDE0455318.1 methyltransferase type 11 [Gammaproteobacteria bacterium]
MSPATSAEIEGLARRHGLQVIRATKSNDASERQEVSWEAVWLQLPDDGTGALPLLRHVVFNDQKSSTYKLALLRALLRIADGAAGFARPGANDDHVELPLGLVALYWIRSFQPLIKADLPQQPRGNQHLGFVKAGFRGLMDRSPFDLRVGQRFSEKDAENLIRAIREAANCIRRMPANYITYPGSEKPVFPCTRGGPVRLKNSVSIDEAFLWSLGSFSVPRNLWQAMGRYAAWLEPAVLNEWIRMMRSYEQKTTDGKRSWDEHWKALEWLAPEHDTDIARRRAETLRADGFLYCVWTGKRLTKVYEIDHCFPFAAWPCNDLWNLLPSDRRANQNKSDRLPSPDALDSAKPRLLDWWHSAYQQDIRLKATFEDEARSALPATGLGESGFTLESVFDGLMFQQLVLKRDQQLREWQPA